MLPPAARQIIDENNAKLKCLLTSNVKSELPRASNAALITELIFTFFAGLCIEENALVPAASVKRKIDQFMAFLRKAE
jgi:hypothetical protein